MTRTWVTAATWMVPRSGKRLVILKQHFKRDANTKRLPSDTKSKAEPNSHLRSSTSRPHPELHTWQSPPFTTEYATHNSVIFNTTTSLKTDFNTKTIVNSNYTSVSIKSLWQCFVLVLYLSKSLLSHLTSQIDQSDDSKYDSWRLTRTHIQ